MTSLSVPTTLPVVPSFFSLEPRQVVASTNDEARALAEAGAGEGTVVWARQQNAGRGRSGRRWESPEGNLYCSVVLCPQVPLAEAAQLSFVTAVALWEAVRSTLPEAVMVSCKWPNDLLVDGVKVAGVLLESGGLFGGREGSSPWLVIGTGVNVVSAPPATLHPAGWLAQFGAEITPEDLLVRYLVALYHWYQVWRAEGFEPIRRAWLERGQTLGQQVMARLAQGEEQVGQFAGLDGQGALLLECDGHMLHIQAADVFFASPRGG